MALFRNQSFEIGMESSYADGGSASTFVPVHLDAKPEINQDVIENPTYTGTGARATFLPGAATNGITVKWFLKGSGTGSKAPEWGKLIRLSGFSETTSSNVVYSPVDSNYPSATVKFNLDGLFYIMSGSRGTSLSIELEEKKQATAELKILGLNATSSASAFVAPTFTDSAIIAPVVSGMGLTIGGQSYVIQKLSLKLDNTEYVEGSLNANNGGINEVTIQDRMKWGGTMVVKRTTTNDTEWEANMRAATEMAVTSTGFGPTGNKIAVAMSNVQIEKIEPTEVGGQVYSTVTFRINKGSTLANEFSLTVS